MGRPVLDRKHPEHAISEIRHALADDKENAVFIQTIPRNGYRFAASVVALDKEVDSSRVEENREAIVGESRRQISPKTAETGRASDAGSGKQFRRVSLIQAPEALSAEDFPPILEPAAAKPFRRRIWLVISASVAAVGVAWILMTVPEPAPAPKIVDQVQLTRSHWPKVAPIVSDDVRVYFMEVWAGRFAVSFIPLLGGEEPTPMALPFPNAYLCDLSPDGRWLLVRSFAGFWREEGPL